MAGAGYDIGASASSSSGASQSGAVDTGSDYYGGEFHGPGSLVLTNTDQRGSIGATAPGGNGWLTWAVVAAVVVAGVLIFRKLF